jgi:putative spermidine/putrescine transport system substrate-binding protein
MRTNKLVFTLFTLIAVAAFVAACAPKAATTATGDCPGSPELIAAAQAEGSLTTIALPHDWANYGEIIETYKTACGMQVNELNPDAGSADELEAIRANKDSKGPQAPDVIDVGVAYGPTSKEEGLLMPYKVATWDTIPLKDEDGAWWAEYYGFLTFEIIKGTVDPLPVDWEDLLKPEFKGKVAMAGDVLKSNQSVQTVFGAGMARAGLDAITSEEDALKAAEAGLQFWKEMYDSGNFIPVIADQGRIAAGETPVTMEWNYLALANRDALAGNPELDIVVPAHGVIAGPYAGAISAYAPHPNAAKLWWEFVMSDVGQLLYLEGYAYPIRYNDMAARGVIPEELAAKLPPAEDAARAVFLTVDQLNVSKTYITENWRKVVYGE